MLIIKLKIFIKEIKIMAKIEFTVTAEEKERIDEFVRDNRYSSRAKMLHKAIDYLPIALYNCLRISHCL